MGHHLDQHGRRTPVPARGRTIETTLAGHWGDQIDLRHIGSIDPTMPSRSARMTKTFKIIDSRRCGLSTCEFDIIAESGTPVVGDFFPIKERGSLWEYIVVSVEQRTDFLTLECVAWIPTDGAFVGTQVSTRAMTTADRKRWAKALPDGFFEQEKSAS